MYEAFGVFLRLAKTPIHFKLEGRDHAPFPHISGHIIRRVGTEDFVVSHIVQAVLCTKDLDDPGQAIKLL